MITTLHAWRQTVYYSRPIDATLYDLGAKASLHHVAEKSEHSGYEYECDTSLLEIRWSLEKQSPASSTSTHKYFNTTHKDSSVF